MKTLRRAKWNGRRDPRGALRGADPRWVFVVGCPRSGTTFTAESLGRVPGITDLGEVARFKALIPTAVQLVADGDERGAEQLLRRTLLRSARFGLGGGTRCLEQTPESTFVIRQLAAAFPAATFVHLVRDGRDVAASLMQRGWLASGASGDVADANGRTADNADQPYGPYARFWVEPALRSEFEAADEARRCAWAWRRYESEARGALAELPPERVVHLRYEDMVRNPEAAAAALARGLGLPEREQAFRSAFRAAHSDSIGRYRAALSATDIETVEAEAGGLLRELGYLSDYSSSSPAR